MKTHQYYNQTFSATRTGLMYTTHKHSKPTNVIYISLSLDMCSETRLY